MGVMKKLTVTGETSGVDNTGLFWTSTRRGESSIGAGPFPAEEVFGGASEYFSFWQLPFWPFNRVRLFDQEEE